jgi:hypothetical protein
MFQAARFKWEGDMLFAGREVAATALPWTYVPVWMAVTTPPVVLCGLLWAAVATLVTRKDERWWRIGLWTVGVAPIVLAIAKHSTLYDSWRHLLFVYPPLVVLAASGWCDLLALASNRRLLRAAALVALVAGCAEPLLFMVRNHPHEVVYFNALVGGPRGAYLRYELDYWGNSLLEATRWSADAARCVGGPLAVSGWPEDLVAEDVSRFPSLFFVDAAKEDHHVYVQLLRDSRDGLIRTMQRGDILHVVSTRDGAPLAVVLAGPRFPEIPGWASTASGDQVSPRGARVCAEIDAAFRRMQSRHGVR